MSKTNKFLDDMMDTGQNPDLTTNLFGKIDQIRLDQRQYTNITQQKYSYFFMKSIYNGSHPDSDDLRETLYPVSGEGIDNTKVKNLKSGKKSLLNIKQIISRVENLISVAKKGHKTAEVQNEIDTLLSTLIDKKKISTQYRDNLMKSLFN
jgi:hypothetical protein